MKNRTPRGLDPVKDNWIYIQEPGVEVGRLQIFNHWSPYLVADPADVLDATVIRMPKAYPAYTTRIIRCWPPCWRWTRS